MKAARWDHVAELFQQAIGLPAADRDDWLRRSNYGPEVRDQVELLLAGDAGAEEDGFLEPPGTADFADAPPDPFLEARRGAHLRCPHCHYPIVVVPSTDPVLYTCELCGTTIRTGTETPAPPEPGQENTLNWEPSAILRRFGRFSLIHWLGEGGYGIVYKARDPLVGRLVALKVPRLGNLGTAKDRELFLREGRAAGQLRHPSIVPIFEVGEVDGTPYIVSEFVEGVTLADLLADSGLAPDFREGARIAAELADALQHAHDGRVVHRDVKPSNVMIDRQGRPRLLDFGLAKRDATEFTIAISGRPLGTPAYMSPEQARGEGGRVDGRTDIYGLGAVLYFLITRASPFAGNERMIVQKVIHDDPPAPRTLNDKIPRDLQTICQKAMAKGLSRRYPTAGELALDLRRFLDGRPIGARPVGRVEKAWRLCARNPRLSIAIGTAAASLVAVAVVSTALAVSTHRSNIDRTRQLSIADQQLALQFLERGEIGPGLLRLERALGLARSIGDAELAHSAEANLAAWSPQHPPLRSIFDHPSEVGRVAGSPDGKTFVAIRADGAAQPWDVARNEPIGGPLRSGKRISSVAFSPDSTRFLTADEVGSLRLWDASTARAIDRDFAGPLAPVREIAFVEGGRTIVTLGVDGTFLRRDATTGRPSGPVIGKPCSVTTAAIGPDGLRGLVASVTVAGVEVRLWDLVTGRPIGEPLEHGGRAWAAKFSPDGKLVATGSSDSLVRLWDATRVGAPLHTWPGDPFLSGLDFSPDGTAVLAATGPKSARAWDVATGQPRGEELMTSAQSYALAFSPDGRLMATGGADGRVRLWDARTGRPIGPALPHLASLTHLAFLPGSGSLLTCSGERVVRVWSIAAPVAPSIALPVPGKTRHATLSPDGSFVVATNELGEVHFLGGVDGRPIQPPWRSVEPVDVVSMAGDGRVILLGGLRGRVELRRVADGRAIGPGHSLNGPIVATAFARDGSTAVATCGDGTAIVLDARTGMARGPLLRHASRVQRACVSATGSLVVTGSTDGTVRLWDGSTGAPIGPPLAHWGDVADLALSPDGRRLITAELDGPARLWDVATARPIVPLDHDGRVLVAEFSPDGRLAVTGGLDGKVRLWDAEAGRRVGPILSGIGDMVFAATFSGDGRLIAAAGRNGDVRLWDASNGLPIGPRLGVPGSYIDHLAFHPGRSSLLSLGSDEVARLWTIPGPSTVGASGLTGLELNDRDEVVAVDGPALKRHRAIKPLANP